MDKRKEANMRVKEKITKSLFDLMYKKSFSDISITELIRAAGVARVSFYRNYNSKEDVLMKLIDDVLEEYRSGIDWSGPDYYTEQNIGRSFACLKKYGEFVLDLYEFGYGSILLEKLNRFHEEIAGNMPNSSIEKYYLYMFIGALFNTSIVWLRSGAKEDESEIAAMFCSTLQRICENRDCSFPVGGIQYRVENMI